MGLRSWYRRLRSKPLPQATVEAITRDPDDHAATAMVRAKLGQRLVTDRNPHSGWHITSHTDEFLVFPFEADRPEPVLPGDIDEHDCHHPFTLSNAQGGIIANGWSLRPGDPAVLTGNYGRGARSIEWGKR